MNILKKTQLLLLFSLISVVQKSRAQTVVFFKDSVFEVQGVKIKVERGFRRDATVRLDLLFTNLTNKYALINYEDIIIKQAGKEILPKARRPWIIVPPKDIRKVKLQFENTGRISLDAVSFCLKTINFADSLVKTHPSVHVLSKFKSVVEDGSLRVEVLEAIPKRKEYVVKISVQFKTPYFVAFDCSKARFSEITKGDFSNIKKGSTEYNPRREKQNITFVFPCEACDVKNNSYASLILDGVFNEYSLRSVKGCDFILSVTTRENNEAKEKKEKAIEAIE